VLGLTDIRTSCCVPSEDDVQRFGCSLLAISSSSRESAGHGMTFDMAPGIRCGRAGCAAPPLMPPAGWPPSGSPAVSELRCAKHLRSQFRWQGLSADIGSGIGAAVGILCVIAGYVLVALIGRNYGPCQGIASAAFSPGACEQASAAHWGGLIVLVAGGMILLAMLASLFRR
jgi:hypothetical protein